MCLVSFWVSYVHRDTRWCHAIGVSHWGHAQHLQELRGCSGSYLYKEPPSVDISPPMGLGKVTEHVGKHLNKVKVARGEAMGAKSPELEIIPQHLLTGEVALYPSTWYLWRLCPSPR